MIEGEKVLLNGEIVPRAEAALSLEERAALFGDAVYEVIRFCGGRPFRMEQHLTRMRRSLAGMEIEAGGIVERVAEWSSRLAAANGRDDCTIYWQISRGAATRDVLYPEDSAPTSVALCYPCDPLRRETPQVVRTITRPDERWHRVDLKTVMLAPNMLARNAAERAGCEAAILCRGNVVTEANTSNLFIVRGGELWTHPADQWILDGVTRGALLECATELDLRVVERKFRVVELMLADEILLCGTTTKVAAVGEVDGRAIDGAPGPVTRALGEAFVAMMARDCEVTL